MKSAKSKVQIGADWEFRIADWEKQSRFDKITASELRGTHREAPVTSYQKAQWPNKANPSESQGRNRERTTCAA